MLIRSILVLSCLVVMNPARSAAASANEVDLVFCMDLSGSTNGLIPDFQNKIWQVVNDLYRLKPTPRLRIGLIGFSRPSFGRENGYVKVLCHLGGDVDRVAYELGSLKPAVEKGDQYVGAALEMAGRMDWTTHPKALRVIYLIGNGTVNAGGLNYRLTCENLLKRNIFINTIYCFQKSIIPAEIPGWNYIADNTGGSHYVYKIQMLSPGKTANINLNSLVLLNEQLNNTYIFYGENGKGRMKKQLEADKICLNSGDVYFYNRVLAKISDPYQSGQSGWDLINYVRIAGPRLDRIERAFLPDSLQSLDPAKLEKLVLEKKDERSRIIREIINQAPQSGLENQPVDSASLQGIIVNSVYKLARDKGVLQLQ